MSSGGWGSGYMGGIEVEGLMREKVLVVVACGDSGRDSVGLWVVNFHKEK